MPDAVAPFTQPTTVDEAEATFSSLGLTEEVIKQVIRVVDREDAAIDTEAHDPTHRGVNRWGHALATLRCELRSHEWEWEKMNPKLRSVLAPGAHLQVCVAAATWVAGAPQTLPRGWHTIQAVENNRQLSLPTIGRVIGRTAPDTATWILCLQRTVTKAKADADGPATVEYLYELSEPMTIVGTGSRKRVVNWRIRCFKGSLSCDRVVEPLASEDQYDHESNDILADLINRK
jgi:hypothetical protein